LELESQERSLAKISCFNPTKNPYLIFGFLWGLPIPYFLVIVHFNAAALEFSMTNLSTMLQHNPLYIFFILHPFLFSGLFGIYGTQKQTSDQRIQHYLENYKKLATTDALTNLYTRSFFKHMATKELQRNERDRNNLCLLFFDIDHFKEVNDQHGHAAGDKLLTDVAVLLKQQTRPYDIIARWGGEEFIALLPNTSKEEAFLYAERFRKTLSKETFSASSIHFNITISCGIAQFKSNYSLERLIDEADQALYLAKHNGRNCTKHFYEVSKEKA